MLDGNLNTFFQMIRIVDKPGTADLEKVKILEGLYNSYVTNVIVYEVDSDERINGMLNLIVSSSYIENDYVKNKLINFAYSYYSTMVDELFSTYEYETIDERLVNLELPTLREYFNPKEKVKSVQEGIA